MDFRTTPVTVVCPDVSENCLARALALAGLIARAQPVTIVGPRLGARVWEPAAMSGGERIMNFPLRGAGQYPDAAAWLRKKLSGSRVVVSKPRMTSLGLTLLAGVPPNQLLL